MKKVFSIILVLLLAGCGIKNANIVPVTKGIAFDCNVTYYNEVYECKGKTDAKGNMVIEFLSPTDIKGLRFAFKEGSVTSSFKDTEYKAQKIVFENSVASFVYDVLANANAEVIKQGDLFYSEGVTDNFEYKLHLGGTGLPIKITTRPDAVTVVFENVKIK